ncbi:XdhC family protein [Agrobacterium fabrum]|uniref:XdhC family protein n=1 Tax=Agrobacterium fabrum TaxID=1176649 RepID=UPI0021579854|nr:XdhC family protein [Agrobacterium fabrum]MCR6727742.1 XdhC family protein [Agrobacterium fabrum]
MDILVAPTPEGRYGQDLRSMIADRKVSRIMVNRDGLSFETAAPPLLILEIVPDPRFVVVGKGLEAAAFAELVNGAGYDTVLLSPDAERLSLEVGISLPVVPLASPSAIKDVPIDAQTACVLFFHDHDLEPSLLAGILDSPAFYIGALGSQRTAAHRISRLQAIGVPEGETRRIRGPIGVVPSTRDHRTLAVSVLAEVLMEAQALL